MAEHKRQHDDVPRHHERGRWDRAVDEDRHVHYESPDRGTRWEDEPDNRAYGTYRTDDRDFHDRSRRDRGASAADEYYRDAREQRHDYLRWTVHNPEDWGQQHLTRDTHPAWGPRERGGYWRQYEAARPHYTGRGPKYYKRSDDRIRDEICDCMTDDPALDASEIVVEVIDGDVTLSGSVMSRDQKRRAEDVAERISGVRDVTNQLHVARNGRGHDWAADSTRAVGTGNTSSRPVNEAVGKGTSSKTTSGTST